MLLVLSSCAKRAPERTRSWSGPAIANTGVDELFAAMRAGDHRGRDFPELAWEDLPRLIELGEGRRRVRAFPRNPLSSRFEAECSEGMVALWLVEGLRQGGGYPSLDALCFRGRVEDSDRGAASEANHDAVLAAYRAWWARVRDLDRDEASALAPLAGTGLRWY